MEEIEREFRPTVVRVFSKSTAFSIEDILNIDQFKISISPMGENKKGSYVVSFIDIDEVRYLADIILSGLFGKLHPSSGKFGQNDEIVAKWEKMGGSSKSPKYNNQPESRIVEVYGLTGARGARVAITVKNGPGRLNAQGGISPLSGGNIQSQTAFFTMPQIRMLMLKLRDHINAYESYHLPQLYDARGKRSQGGRVDCFFTEGNRKAQRDFDAPQSNEIVNESDFDYDERDYGSNIIV